MSARGQSSTVTVKIKENRLTITLKGIVSKKEAERVYTDIRFCVADLKPGFTVVTDLTECRFAYLSAGPILHKAMTFLLDKEVSHVIRIVGKAKIIFRQISRLSKKQKGYTAIYAATTKEAEVKLAELKRVSDEITDS